MLTVVIGDPLFPGTAVWSGLILTRPERTLVVAGERRGQRLRVRLVSILRRLVRRRFITGRTAISAGSKTACRSDVAKIRELFQQQS
jgi:hypothetical protein